MTRPSSASFAQFFPAAPRAARDRAMEREKEKAKRETLESPSSTPSDKPALNRQSVPSATSRPDDPAVARSRRDTSVSDPARTPADDVDALRADMPNTVGSDSSHTSIASSATNASSMRVNHVAVSKNNSYSHVTPLTTIDSPSSSAGFHPTKPDTSNPPYTNGSALKPDVPPDSVAAVNTPNISRRIPARDPSLRVQVIKAAHDPATDRSSRDKKKPKYKEFGLVRKHIYSVQQGERHLFHSLVLVNLANKNCTVNRKMTLPRRPILDWPKAVALTTSMSTTIYPNPVCASRRIT